MDTTRPARTTRTRRILALAALAAATAGVLLPVSPHADAAVPVDIPISVPLTGPAPTVDGAAARRCLELVNAARAAAGLTALVPTAEADGVATEWAQRMAGTQILRHNPELATQLTGWSVIAENVGFGADPDQVHGAFMNSPGHRANILRGNVTQIGVGAVHSADGRLWIAQVFKLPTGVITPDPVAAPAARPVPAQPLPAPAPVPGTDPTFDGAVIANAPALRRVARDAR
ncbi:MAG: CAP domain-containing protein [Janthinobacterium lividum]